MPRLFTLFLTFTLLVSSLPPAASEARQVATPAGFAHAAIRERWQQDEAGRARGTGAVWMWGPVPFYTNYEPHAATPERNHLVQYFDKGRLEINDPMADRNSPWYVTSGLLVKELVSGAVENGEPGTYVLGPAEVPVAGDSDAPQAPTYRSFSRHTGPVRDRSGTPVTAEMLKTGQTRQIAPQVVTHARFEQKSGHNWADVFWQFANSPARPARFEWLYTLGLPITEPYWASVQVAGQPRMVLVQLFERKSLTYNPANLAASQVEMGNVGRHYYNWRYANLNEGNLQTSYDVTVNVGRAPQRAMTVRQSIKIKNSTGRPLSNVVMRAVWNHWEGVFSLRGATVNGAAVTPTWRHGVNVEVPVSVPPGAEAALDLTFAVQPRNVGGRSGYRRDADVLSLGDMLPTVVPWENGGWTYYPYSSLGDHGYHATADYKVVIASDSAERLVVGGSGEMVEVDAGRTRWTFDVPRSRDAAFIISPRFINPHEDPAMRRAAGSATVLGYFLPEHRAAGVQQLDLVAPALQWFSGRLGAYPGKQYTVAEMGTPTDPTDNYAQEYPGVYLMPGSWLNIPITPGTWTWYVPVHEVAHQWFYSIVGSNQIADPWLDEALTTYATAEYVRLTSPGNYQASWRSMTASASRALPVSSGVFSGFSGERQYSAVIYDSGALMLDRVRLAMGDGPFYEALRAYVDRYRSRRAAPSNLLAELQQRSRTELKPIFNDYLTY